MKLDPRQRGILGLALVTLLALTLAYPFLLNRDARHLSAYAEGDEDASSFRAALALAGKTEAILATPHLLDDVEDPSGTLLVVLGAERRYDRSEAQAVLDFLDAGGSVLLVDEKGYGSAIAQAAGFAFDSQRVLDTRNHLGDPKLVASDVRLDGQTYRVLFNSPSRLTPLSKSADVPHETLAATSGAQYPDGSYLDKNGDGVIDLGDEPGPFPLVVRATVGRGTLVMVSDTGPFMNAQMGVAEFQNEAFARALAASLVSGEARILIDEGRHAPPAPLALFDNAARLVGRLTQGALAPVVILVLLASAFAAWRLTRPTQDWSHHEFTLGEELPLPDDVRPDATRAQRLARRRINEKYNIPMEQVQAMTAEELFALTGDRALADAASGAPKADPALFFRTPEASQ